MKRKLFNVLLILSLTMSLTATGIFAESKPAKIQSVSQLKAALNQNLTESEERAVIEETESGVMDAFMTEKMDEAVELLNSQESDLVMKQLPDGMAYAARNYDLGDGCTLTVELSDREEGQALKVPQISTMATSGSSDQWKDYGNRYFTARASVSISNVTASMSLENHYTLSADGIEERSGVADVSWNFTGGSSSKSAPVITDGTAKTAGASDVNMYCTYKFEYKSEKTPQTANYKLNTTVGYVAINKTAKQIKVRQSWNLTKIS
ncbi:hypothetical protein AALA24_09100 [Anaerovoracaceae bacterium 42-11]